MQVNKTTLIIALMLAGAFLMRQGLISYAHDNPALPGLAVGMAGLALLLVALGITHKEFSSTNRFIEICIAAAIGGYVMAYGLYDIHDDPTLLKYALVLVAIIILCIALVQAYREYGHFDISLTGR
jgi:putative effector of murein hydrolase